MAGRIGHAAQHPITQSAKAGSGGVVAQAGRDLVIDARVLGDSRITHATSTGHDAAFAGGFANSGVHIGDVNLRTGEPVQTRYRQQVMRSAPPLLVDRETELSELAAFCSGTSTAHRYQWWRAKAWAGKSALLSWFVLHPPPGVRVVSFFVTARWAGQADRVAFVDNVLEQLLTLLGEQMPPFLTPATREAHMLGLLEDAAFQCQERGERLVLVVDGLDEDRSVTTDPDSHSIAALLPVRPPEGLRVVVSGRPDPPIPGDVPESHPLRNPEIVRELEASPQAKAVRAEMERDLKRLLAGTVERDLLGLLVTAEGGLTADDLAGLTRTGRWLVRDHLNTVAGRSFARRSSDLTHGVGPEVYLLAHEELQLTALDMLSAEEVLAYRQRIHSWAAGYRDRGWPDDTPEYLLGAYHSMLHAVSDVDRATSLCTDRERHEQLFKKTGGDNAAVAQITTTLDTHVNAATPDLVAIGRLAVHRDYLIDRTIRVPAAIPKLWVRLGHPHRATSFARAITSHHRQSPALAAVVDALVEAGHHNGAAETAFSITDPAWRCSALLSVARALTSAGDRDRAKALVDHAAKDTSAITIPYRRDSELVATVNAMVEAGFFERAVEIAESITNLSRRDTALVSITKVLTSKAQHEQNLEIARLIAAPVERLAVLLSAALALSEGGHHDRAAEAIRLIIRLGGWRSGVGSAVKTLVDAGFPHLLEELVDEVALTSRTATDVRDREEAGAVLAGMLAMSEQYERAMETAGTITDPERRNTAWASLVTALTDAGQYDRATEIAELITNPHRRALALMATLVARTRAEGLDRDAEDSRSAADRAHQKTAVALTAVGLARVENCEHPSDIERVITASRQIAPVVDLLIKSGDHDLAVETARAIEWRDRDRGDSALDSVGRRLIEAGRYDEAVLIASKITDSDQRNLFLASAVESQLEDGLPGRAVETTRLITAPYRKAITLVSVVATLIEGGEHERVEDLVKEIVEVVHGIDDFDQSSWVLTSAVRALSRAGHQVAVEGLVDEIDRATRAVTRASRRNWALVSLVKVLIDAGLHDRAVEAARSISAVGQRVSALVEVAEAMSVAGLHDRAWAVVDDIVEESRLIPDAWQHTRSLISVVTIMLAAGHHDLATATARSIPDSDQRARSLASVMEALAEAGRHELVGDLADEAIGPANGSIDQDRRNVVLASVARSLTTAGQRTRAEAVLDDMVRSACSITGGQRREWALLSALEALAGAGFHERVHEIALLIRESSRLSSTPASIAKTLARSGHYGHALEVIETMADGYDRNSALVTIVEASAATGRHEFALETARSITDAYLQGWALTCVGESLVHSGLRDRARAVVTEILHLAPAIAAAHRRDWVLARAVKILATTGHDARIEPLLRTLTGSARMIVDPYQRNSVLIAMAETLATAGLIDRALDTVEAITDQFQRDTALKMVAAVLVAVGAHDQAEDVVHSVTEVDQRCRAMASAARQMIGMGEAWRAERMAALALQTAHWSTASEDLSVISTGAMLAMAEEFTALERSSW